MLWFFTEDGSEGIVKIMGMKGAMSLSGAYVKQCRAQNEIAILKKEMHALIQYYTCKEGELLEAMDECRDALIRVEQSAGNSTTPSNITSHTSISNAATAAESSSCSHRYVVSKAKRQHNAEFIRGELAILSNSLNYVVRPQLKMASKEFAGKIPLAVAPSSNDDEDMRTPSGKAQLFVTHQKYQDVTDLLVTWLRQEEEEGAEGTKQGVLVTWYMDHISGSMVVEMDEQMIQAYKLVRAIILKLIKNNTLIVVKEEGGDQPRVAHRMLVVNPDYIVAKSK